MNYVCHGHRMWIIFLAIIAFVGYMYTTTCTLRDILFFNQYCILFFWSTRCCQLRLKSLWFPLAIAGRISAPVPPRFKSGEFGVHYTTNMITNLQWLKDRLKWTATTTWTYNWNIVETLFEVRFPRQVERPVNCWWWNWE